MLEFWRGHSDRIQAKAMTIVELVIGDAFLFLV
jgi:hypothetical protein